MAAGTRCEPDLASTPTLTIGCMAKTLGVVDDVPLEAYYATTNLSPERLAEMGRSAAETHALWWANRDAIFNRAVTAIISALRTMESPRDETANAA